MVSFERSTKSDNLLHAYHNTVLEAASDYNCESGSIVMF